MLDVIIRANFGVKKLRGLGNTRGHILEFPIEMAGNPYNSAALPRSLWRSIQYETIVDLYGVCDWPMPINVQSAKPAVSVSVLEYSSAPSRSPLLIPAVALY